MKIKIILANFVYISFMLFSLKINAAEINARQVGSNKIYSISIIGEIKEGDYSQLINTIKTEGYLPYLINIKSKGGSVTEAIKIAKFINKALIPVNARDYCYSSCFYIWVASIERNAVYEGMFEGNESMDEIMNSKVIGLHRPYYNKSYFSSLTMTEARNKHKELEVIVRQYLKNMGVHEKWIDEMMMYSSENIKLITRRELELEFGFTSHAFEEWLLAKCPINEKDLLFGKAEMVMKTKGIDGANIKLSKQKRDDAFNKYLEYTKCKEKSISQSQEKTIKNLFK